WGWSGSHLPVAKRGDDFHQQDRHEDQGAADQTRWRQTVAEEDRTENGCEDRFGGKKKRRLWRGSMSLADHLKREGDASGEDPGIEDFQSRHTQGIEADGLQQQREHERNESGYAELRHRERDRPA